MDPYSVLGVHPTASKDEIKAAFRKHALRHHPDQHVHSPAAVKAQSEAQFKAVKAAYDVLNEANFRHRDRSSRASGFRPHTAAASSASSSYGAYARSAGYDGRSYSNYNQFMRRAASGARSNWHEFVNSGSAALTAGLAGLVIAGLFFLEPMFSSAWETHNSGKLFDQIEQEVAERRQAAAAGKRTAEEVAAAKAAALLLSKVEQPEASVALDFASGEAQVVQPLSVGVQEEGGGAPSS